MPHQAVIAPPTFPESSLINIASQSRPIISSEMNFPSFIPCGTEFNELVMKSASPDNVSNDIV